MLITLQIIGSTLSFAILNAIKPLEESTIDENEVNSTESLSQSQSVVTLSLRYCGADDCQDANVTQDNIEQYVPTNKTPIYIIVGSFLAIMITGK